MKRSAEHQRLGAELAAATRTAIKDSLAPVEKRLSNLERQLEAGELALSATAIKALVRLLREEGL